jgi:hypothetical protein
MERYVSRYREVRNPIDMKIAAGAQLITWRVDANEGQVVQHLLFIANTERMNTLFASYSSVSTVFDAGPVFLVSLQTWILIR